MPPKTTAGAQAFAKILRREPTDAEYAMWQELRRNQMQGVRFRRQVPIGPYVADFACLRPRIIIELDGGQHGDAIAYDAARTAYLAESGFRVLRFWNNEVFTDRQAVLDTIWAAVRDAAHPKGH